MISGTAQPSTKVLSLAGPFLAKAQSELKDKKYDSAYTCSLKVLKQPEVTAEQVVAAQKLLVEIGEGFFLQANFVRALEATKQITEQKRVADREAYLEANVLECKIHYAEFCKDKKEEDRAASEISFSKAMLMQTTVDLAQRIQEYKDVLNYLYTNALKQDGATDVTFENLYMHSYHIVKANRMLANGDESLESMDIVLDNYKKSLKYFKKSPIAWLQCGILEFSRLAHLNEPEEIRQQRCELAIKYINAGEKFCNNKFVVSQSAFFIRGKAYGALRDYHKAVAEFRKGFSLIQTLDSQRALSKEAFSKDLPRSFNKCQEELIREFLAPKKADEEKKASEPKADINELLELTNALNTCPNSCDLIYARLKLLNKLGMHELAVNDVELMIWIIKNKFDTTHQFSLVKLQVQKAQYMLSIVMQAIAKNQLEESVDHFKEFHEYFVIFLASVHGNLYGMPEIFESKENWEKHCRLQEVRTKIVESLSDWKVDEAEKYIRHMIDGLEGVFDAKLYGSILLYLNHFYLKKLIVDVDEDDKLRMQAVINALNKTKEKLDLGKETVYWLVTEIRRLEIKALQCKVKKVSVGATEMPVSEAPKLLDDPVDTAVSEKQKSLREIKKQQKKKEKRKQKRLEALTQDSQLSGTSDQESADDEKESANEEEIVEVEKEESVVEIKAENPPLAGMPKITKTEAVKEIKEVKKAAVKIPNVKVVHDFAAAEVYKQFKDKGVKRIYTVGGYVCEKLKPSGKSHLTDYDFVFGAAKAKENPLAFLRSIFPKAKSIISLDEAASQDRSKESKAEAPKINDKIFMVEMETGEKVDIAFSEALSDEEMSEEEALAVDGNSRDFTANAIYLNSDGEAFDSTGRGYKHLLKGILRAIVEMSSSFANDPIRALRAINFYNKREWHVTKNMWEAIKNIPEKIINEKLLQNPGRTNSWMMKMLTCGYATKNFEAMFSSQLIEKLLPEFNAALKMDSGLQKLILENLADIDERRKQNIKTGISDIYYSWAQIIAYATGKIYAEIVNDNLLIKSNFEYYWNEIRKDPLNALKVLVYVPEVTDQISAEIKAINKEKFAALIEKTPSKVNNLLKKILTNGCAEKNFEVMFKNNLIEGIFPELHAVLRDNEGIRKAFFNDLKNIDTRANRNAKTSISDMYYSWARMVAGVTKQSYADVVNKNALFKIEFDYFANQIKKDPINVFKTILYAPKPLAAQVSLDIKAIPEKAIEEKVEEKGVGEDSINKKTFSALINASPVKVNNLLRKLLTSGEAKINFEILLECQVIQKIFPQMARFFGHFETNLKFITGQLIKIPEASTIGTSKFNFQKILATWAVFIAKKTNQDLKQVVNSHPLFSAQFHEVENIFEETVFKAAIKEYEVTFPPLPPRGRASDPRFTSSGMGKSPVCSAALQSVGEQLQQCSLPTTTLSQEQKR